MLGLLPLRSSFYSFNSFVFSRAQTTSAKLLPKLTLYTGSDCQLCDVAKNVLLDLRKEMDFDLSEYDIRNDTLPDINQWRRAYQYDIPVLHLDGKEIARHRLNRESVKLKILQFKGQSRSD